MSFCSDSHYPVRGNLAEPVRWRTGHDAYRAAVNTFRHFPEARTPG